jgi:hypothetical protein
MTWVYFLKPKGRLEVLDDFRASVGSTQEGPLFALGATAVMENMIIIYFRNFSRSGWYIIQIPLNTSVPFHSRRLTKASSEGPSSKPGIDKRHRFQIFGVPMWCILGFSRLAALQASTTSRKCIFLGFVHNNTDLVWDTHRQRVVNEESVRFNEAGCSCRRREGSFPFLKMCLKMT